MDKFIRKGRGRLWGLSTYNLRKSTENSRESIKVTETEKHDVKPIK